jgi:hypothetical protein
MLVKPTTAVFGLLPLVLYQPRSEVASVRTWLRDRLDARLVALVSIPGLLAIVWTAMADAYLRTKPATVFLAPNNLRDYYLDFGTRLEPAIAALITYRFVFLVVGAPFLIVLVAGIIAGVRSAHRGFWIGTALTLVLPALVFWGLYRRHDYYQIAISSAVAALVGLGGAWLLERVLARGRLPTLVLGAAALASLVYVYASEADYWMPIYAPVADPEGVLAPAAELAGLTRPDDLVVMVGRSWDPDIFNYARRKGLLIAPENASTALYQSLPSQGYDVFFSVDPAHDPTDVMRWWAWNGAMGPRTFEVGASADALPRSDILSTDDTSAFERAAAGRRALVSAPLVMTCDGRSVQVPVDPSGTWLLTDAPSGTIVSLDLSLGPLPARRVFVLRPEAMFERTSTTASCSGPGTLTIQHGVAAPAPPR